MYKSAGQLIMRSILNKSGIVLYNVKVMYSE